MNKKIIVRGPALSQSGYGEQTRFALRALRKFSDRFDIYLLNTPWGNTGWIWQNDEERNWIDSLLFKTIQYQSQGGKFDLSLQVTIPSEWQNLADYNVGYTAGIETNKISTSWFEGCFRVQKILVTSEHAKQGIENTSYNVTHNVTKQTFNANVEVPIEVVSYPVRNYEPKEIELNLKHDFNFLTVCQWGPRKNLENLIKCFLEEFKEKNVGLVIKTQTVRNCLIDREMTDRRLRELITTITGNKERKCSIHLLHGDLTPEEMTYVYRHPKIKALISMTHGEGFGLPIFESVYNGLPVIAPAWSGQSDFIYMPIKAKNEVRKTCMISAIGYDIKNIQPEAVWDQMLIPESQWCFPRDWHAKQQMREIHKNYGYHKKRAGLLQKHICEEFNSDKMLKHFADSVFEDFPVIDIGNILTIQNEIKNELLEEVVEFS